LPRSPHPAQRLGIASVFRTLSVERIGAKLGRASPEDTVVFDSTGIAVQDVAAAAVVYERALTEGLGLAVDFAG